VQELAAKWHCDNDDAQIYAGRIGVHLSLDGNRWCATKGSFVNLQESPAGFGITALEAMAELCKALGYKPQKTWGATFVDLLK
jgi:ribosomal protein S5